jgi:hypothetical protein
MVRLMVVVASQEVLFHIGRDVDLLRGIQVDELIHHGVKLPHQVIHTRSLFSVQ